MKLYISISVAFSTAIFSFPSSRQGPILLTARSRRTEKLLVSEIFFNYLEAGLD